MIAELEQDDQRDTVRRAREAVLSALAELGGESRRQPLLAKAVAEGGFTERELAAPAPVETRARYSSEIIYRLSHALYELKREGLVETPGWNLWRLTDGAASSSESALATPVSSDRRDALRAMPYHEYLRTPEWTTTRAAALTRAGRRCALDRRHTEHLGVHHQNLERLGAERTSDLIVLCRDCHQTHYHVRDAVRLAGTAAEAEAHRAPASIPPPAALDGGPAAAPAGARPPGRSGLRRFFRRA